MCCVVFVVRVGVHAGCCVLIVVLACVRCCVLCVGSLLVRVVHCVSVGGCVA